MSRSQTPPFKAAPDPSSSPVHFVYQPIEFKLDSDETPEHHAPETMAGGVAVFDYNNDGKLDIFFTNGADIKTLKKDSPKYSNRLFENDGNGHFTDVTEKAGLTGTGYDTGVAIGDYDNDGYEDIFLAGVHRNTLYHNNGDGTFTDVTEKAGLNKPDPEYGPLWAVAGAWIDVNNDGLLDLVVINYLKWDVNHEPVCAGYGHNDYCHPKMYKPTPNQLFINKGDGTFRDASVEAGFRAHPGKGMGAAAADSELTGRMDLIVPNDKLMNQFYKNQGSGKFEEVAFEENLALREDGVYISGMGTDFRDLDNDGYPDIVIVALDGETFPVFKNTGKGSFTEVTRESGMTKLTLPMAGYSPMIADFDNDGWKDIFVSRGHVQSLASTNLKIEQPNTVFRKTIAATIARRINGLLAILDKPLRIREAAFFLHVSGSGKEEDFGGHILRLQLTTFDLLGVIPERRCFGFDEVANHEPLELAEGLPLQPTIGCSDCRILTHDEHAFHLAVLHVEPIAQSGMVSSDARQPTESEIVFLRRFFAVPGLQQTDDVLIEVAPPSRAARMTLDVLL